MSVTDVASRYDGLLAAVPLPVAAGALAGWLLAIPMALAVGVGSTLAGGLVAISLFVVPPD